MNNELCTFSVLMSLFYKEKSENINDSLRSLYFQTLKPNEIILVKEGILNEKQNQVVDYWINKFGDNIIKVIDSKETKGLAACLNLGIQACKSEYIARFDSDDECLPDRFEKQMNFLRLNPQVVLLGGQIEEFDEEMTHSLGFRRVPVNYSEILKFGKWRSPFNHQTVIYKRSVALQLGSYPVMKVYEDYAFWGHFFVNDLKVANLPDILVKARTGKGLIVRRAGIGFLKGELIGIKYLHDIKFLNSIRYCTLVVSRIVVRMLPSKVITKIYASLRQ